MWTLRDRIKGARWISMKSLLVLGEVSAGGLIKLNIAGNVRSKRAANKVTSS